MGVLEKGIEGRGLEKSQQSAVTTKGKNICVNAGAGSGKTFTIVAKVIHLLEDKHATANEILVLAYNNSVAKELRERFLKLATEFPHLEEQLLELAIRPGEDKDRKVHTFHSYCFDQIKKNEEKTVAKFFDTSDADMQKIQRSAFYENIIQELSDADFKFMNAVTNFLNSNLDKPIDIFSDIKTMQDYQKYIKPRYICLKKIDNVPLKVKSIAELEIANFLYLKGIEFIYEDEYLGEFPREWDANNNKKYHPDFHLIKKNEKGEIEYDLFLEHFALNKNLQPPEYFENKDKYLKDYHIKVKHLGEDLIHTYSYQHSKGVLIEELIKQLKQKGIEVPDKNILSNEEVLKEFKEGGYVEKFNILLSAFLVNCKLRDINIKSLYDKINEVEDINKGRAKLFLGIFEKVYERYHQILEEEGLVDFEDMLLEGKKFIETENLKYIIVDEFQDISPLRATILKKLTDVNKGAQLFTVGDDWQAIYGFSGGDVKIIVNEYEKYFGKREMVDLGITYRFNDILCELSSLFILQNEKGQLNKKVKGVGNFKGIPLEILMQTKDDSENFNITFSISEHICKTLDNLFKNDSDNNIKKILFLSRFNTYTYKNGYQQFETFIKTIFKSKAHLIEFSTIHRSKGDEADYVFLMNVCDGLKGFPSGIEDDELFRLIKEDEEIFEYEEERRLFYVALTRTKNKVFLYGESDTYFINHILGNETYKEKHHYNQKYLPILKNPKKMLLIGRVFGRKDIIKDETPAKNNNIEKGDQIIQINEIKEPTLKNYYETLNNCEGKNIKLHIKNIKGVTVKELTPYKYFQDESKQDEFQYQLGMNCYEIALSDETMNMMLKYSN